MSNVSANFVISVDTDRLCGALRGVVPGEMVTWQELSAVIARDVQAEARGQLWAARSKLEREERTHFVAVPGKGLRRLTAKEVALSGPLHLRRVSAAARRGQRRMTIDEKDWNALPNADRVAANASQAVLGALEHAAKPKAIRAIEERIQNNGALPSYGEVLEYFKK